MAENQNEQNLNSVKPASFNKGLIKDLNDSFVPEGVWINAINAVTNSHKGDTGTLGNEPSNTYCMETPYDIIGLVRRDTDTWVIFSTNDVISEIGIFTESTCEYKKVISDKCLNFDRAHLITGFIQYNFDCTWSVFFADGLNPDRALNLDNIPYQITGYDTTNPTCPIPIYNECLDCEKTRLNYLTNPPCYTIRKAKGAGSLLNGSYQAVIAYSINGQRVTNYFTPSNVQGMWDHSGVAGGLEINATNLDTRFEEYELVIVSTVNSQTVARKIGNYSTSQNTVYIDNYSEANVSVDITLIPLVTPVYEKCDKMFALNGYLLRSGVYSKFQFNYQPLANQITAKWQEVEYPADYYYNGGTNTSYMRDEQYAFFIRWLYNDGDKSASYHIPGRAPLPSDLVTTSGADVIYPTENLFWQVYNTATVTNPSINQYLPDGGLLTREGLMGYWESTERYPINRPEVWGDLCGAQIRHHKMPDNSVSHIHSQGGDKIYVLGVKFDNIQLPVDNQGNVITNIIGFEILRGSREGNRTIIAKGLINNMREYSNTSGQKVLYQNYPYNDLRPDYFLTSAQFFNQGDSPNDVSTPLSIYKKDYYSFHSPETNFNKPFLSYNEMKVYTKEYGTSVGKFEYPFGDPKQKLITNASYLIALTVGLGIALKAAFGNNQLTKTADDVTNLAAAGNIGLTYGALGPNTQGPLSLLPYSGGVPLAFGSGSWGSIMAGAGSSGTMYGNQTSASFPQLVQTGGDLSNLDFRFYTGGYMNKIAQVVWELAKYALFISTILYWAGQGLDQAVGIIYELIPFRHYALQWNSHAFYSNYKPVNYSTSLNNTRREHNKSVYIKDQIQSFDFTYNINNLYRNDYVAANIRGTFPEVSLGDTTLTDTTRRRLKDIPNISYTDPTKDFISSTTSAYYAGLKIDYQNQYGQLEGIVEIPIQDCYIPTPTNVQDKVYNSGTQFGGDIYINRYTEKNPFFYYTKWLFNVPDGTAFDYSQYSNPLYPRYWANFEKFDSSSIQVPNSWSSLTSGGLLDMVTAASAYHHLDRKTNTSGTFQVKKAYYYTFNNGVRDFFVESEVNLAYRDYGDLASQRHYDHTLYTDLYKLFRTDLIEAGNYYRYDYSLSISKLFNGYVSFGATLPRTYDPLVSETCYSYNDTRVLYSLPQQTEQARDAWRIYLTNNYKDFENVISCIKPINRTGSIILFQDAEPTSVTGVDQLQTSAGTKITIGDGGLFQQPFQSLVNADDEYEYASCQDTRSAVNTPYGLFWMSRDTGKILHYTGGQITDIAMNGMRYWFAEHLPNVLTTQFPNFTATENTVTGIGCLSAYDTQYEIVYFCKRDFKSKGLVEYEEATNKFFINRQIGKLYVDLGDPEYFEDCSWTISYDPKTKMWLSFHDWHPNHTLGTNDHFYTAKGNSLWKHNNTCKSFCNYYGVDYPFEVEFPVNTGITVNYIKSIEYTLEVLNYSTDCIDPYHVLNANFDYAMIYNTEQNSGLLRLNLKPYNPVDLLKYPKVLSDSIEILYAKEENKYRFNQFWDATKDRGEFTGDQWRMFNTEQNGYRKLLNTTYIDYNKSPLQRKKFRHYGNRLILGKLVSNNLKYNLKVVNTKETLSPR